MSNFMPFLSIDIDTNGLSDYEDLKILEMFILFDDIGLHGGIRKSLHIIWKHDEVVYQNEMAKEKNESRYKALLEENIQDAHYVEHRDQVVELMNLFLSQCVSLNQGYPLHMAARNSSNFIEAVMRKCGISPSSEQVSHRFIDVQSLYFTDFGYVPPLEKILQKEGIKTNGSVRADTLAINELVVKKIYQRLGM